MFVMKECPCGRLTLALKCPGPGFTNLGEFGVVQATFKNPSPSPIGICVGLGQDMLSVASVNAPFTKIDTSIT